MGWSSSENEDFVPTSIATEFIFVFKLSLIILVLSSQLLIWPKTKGKNQ